MRLYAGRTARGYCHRGHSRGLVASRVGVGEGLGNRFGSAPLTAFGDPLSPLESYGLAMSPSAVQLGMPAAVPEHAVLVPSEMFALGDAVVAGWQDPQKEPFFRAGQHFRPYYAHRGTANMLFCDGHADAGRRAHWEAKTDTARRRWNRDHEPHPEHFK